MIRLIDLVLATLGLFVAFPVLFIVYAVGLFESGSPLFFQERVGKDGKPFTLIKFRTMAVGTPSVASHLASQGSITRTGLFLRKTKLDELPQLWNVLRGEMSLVGPRPNLFSQYELIKERNERDVYSVLPGITGLAQVQNIDMSEPAKLAMIDAHMINTMSAKQYFWYIFTTLRGRGAGDALKG